eukprot:14870629-Ditylum_brightwellii.AAC.1
MDMDQKSTHSDEDIFSGLDEDASSESDSDEEDEPESTRSHGVHSTSKSVENKDRDVPEMNDRNFTRGNNVPLGKNVSQGKNTSHRRTASQGKNDEDNAMVVFKNNSDFNSNVFSGVVSNVVTSRNPPPTPHTDQNNFLPSLFDVNVSMETDNTTTPGVTPSSKGVANKLVVNTVHFDENGFGGESMFSPLTTTGISSPFVFRFENGDNIIREMSEKEDEISTGGGSMTTASDITTSIIGPETPIALKRKAAKEKTKDSNPWLTRELFGATDATK